ncbi:HupE/UreJ family protein [Marinobacter zhejiangensis]|uniref:HupE / UreJ protein n=1 Tax=Marinobacter zhejiangensis TaxID=488535 RepID=A0A1I4P1D6_9GAMM|nr:HupE/UreJ family protein [Marinobacter zhejiangensis]SFM21568.1 HupE / UreJ protein [Marinobacter zhejiangensis]
MRVWLRCSLLLLLGLVVASPGQADVFRPAFLQLSELDDNRYDVVWRVPARGDRRLGVYVEFPGDTEAVSQPRTTMVGNTHIEQWQIRRTGGLEGKTIRINGLVGGITDVVARVVRLDGSTQVERLLPESPSFRVKPPQAGWQVALTYLGLGFEHILMGIDHLLFVLALLMIVKGSRRIVATVTAFTVAHSITLVAATLGWIYAPGPPVEAIIALSIVFVSAEVVQSLRGRSGLTERAPWVVAFSFGLLHGFGFAGALTEMGLPEKAVPLALLMFNVGVELGQLAFVLAVFTLVWVWRSLKFSWSGWVRYLPPYTIGSLAAFWTLERVIIGFVS